MTRRRLILWVPMALLCLLAGFWFYQLTQPKDEWVRSAMVGERLPDFDLPPATDGIAGLSSRDFIGGKPKLLNIFASWCIPCKTESPQLEALKKAGVEIHAIAVRDKPQDVAQFLQLNGNPFTRIGADNTMQVQLLLGSSGVPETYVIGGDGKIIHQHVGEIRSSDVPDLIGIVERAE